MNIFLIVSFVTLVACVPCSEPPPANNLTTMLTELNLQFLFDSNFPAPPQRSGPVFTVYQPESEPTTPYFQYNLNFSCINTYRQSDRWCFAIGGYRNKTSGMFIGFDRKNWDIHCTKKKHYMLRKQLPIGNSLYIGHTVQHNCGGTKCRCRVISYTIPPPDGLKLKMKLDVDLTDRAMVASPKECNLLVDWMDEFDGAFCKF